MVKFFFWVISVEHQKYNQLTDFYQLYPLCNSCIIFFFFPLREPFHSSQNSFEFFLMKCIFQMQTFTACKHYEYNEHNFCAFEFAAFFPNSSVWLISHCAWKVICKFCLAYSGELFWSASYGFACMWDAALRLNTSFDGYICSPSELQTF